MDHKKKKKKNYPDYPVLHKRGHLKHQPTLSLYLMEPLV